MKFRFVGLTLTVNGLISIVIRSDVAAKVGKR
jgi:hypothetical protein